MDDILGDRTCEGLEDIGSDEGAEIQVTVRQGDLPSVTFLLKDAMLSQKHPTELDSQGNLVTGGDHTLSIFGLVKKVDVEP